MNIPSHIQKWCEESGYTEPQAVDRRWWAFPPNGVMPVPLPPISPTTRDLIPGMRRSRVVTTITTEDGVEVSREVRSFGFDLQGFLVDTHDDPDRRSEDTVQVVMPFDRSSFTVGQAAELRRITQNLLPEDQAAIEQRNISVGYRPSFELDRLDEGDRVQVTTTTYGPNGEVVRRDVDNIGHPVVVPSPPAIVGIGIAASDCPSSEEVLAFLGMSEEDQQVQSLTALEIIASESGGIGMQGRMHRTSREAILSADRERQARIIAEALENGIDGHAEVQIRFTDEQRAEMQAAIESHLSRSLPTPPPTPLPDGNLYSDDWVRVRQMRWSSPSNPYASMSIGELDANALDRMVHAGLISPDHRETLRRERIEAYLDSIRFDLTRIERLINSPECQTALANAARSLEEFSRTVSRATTSAVTQWNNRVADILDTMLDNSLQSAIDYLRIYHSVEPALAKARIKEFQQRYGITDEALATMLRSGKVIWKHGVLSPGKKFKLKPVGMKK